MSALTLRAGRPAARFPDWLSQFLASFGAALAASRDYQRMQTMSDRQLAEKGVVREELPALVFERHFR